MITRRINGRQTSWVVDDLSNSVAFAVEFP
jgi:hypothetical protein